MNSFIGIVIISLLSICCLLVSYHTFLMDDYSLFQYWWDIDDQWDQWLLKGSWVVGIGMSLFFGWLIFHRITEQAKTYFLCWMIGISLFILPFIINRGWYLFALGLFIGIPVFGLSHAFILVNRTSSFSRNTINGVIFTCLAFLGGYLEYQAFHSCIYHLPDYEIKVSSYTVPTFLDWQVEIGIDITDKLTHKVLEFDCWFGNGPHFNICKDINSDSILYLKGDRMNEGHDWTIDLMSEDILEMNPLEEASDCERIARFGEEL